MSGRAARAMFAHHLWEGDGALHRCPKGSGPAPHATSTAPTGRRCRRAHAPRGRGRALPATPHHAVTVPLGGKDFAALAAWLPADLRQEMRRARRSMGRCWTRSIAITDLPRGRAHRQVRSPDTDLAEGMLLVQHPARTTTDADLFDDRRWGWTSPSGRVALRGHPATMTALAARRPACGLRQLPSGRVAPPLRRASTPWALPRRRAGPGRLGHRPEGQERRTCSPPPR